MSVQVRVQLTTLQLIAHAQEYERAHIRTEEERKETLAAQHLELVASVTVNHRNSRLVNHNLDGPLGDVQFPDALHRCIDDLGAARSVNRHRALVLCSKHAERAGVPSDCRLTQLPHELWQRLVGRSAAGDLEHMNLH